VRTLTASRNNPLIARKIGWRLVRPAESLPAGLISVSLALSFPPAVVAASGLAVKLVLLPLAVLSEDIPVLHVRLLLLGGGLGASFGSFFGGARGELGLLGRQFRFRRPEETEYAAKQVFDGFGKAAEDAARRFRGPINRRLRCCYGLLFLVLKRGGGAADFPVSVPRF